MKVKHALPIAALLFAPLAHAQSDHMKGMDMGGGHGHDAAKAPQAKQQHHASGVVKSVDAGKGIVTVSHGAVATLKWPAMTMTFKAQDKKQLEALKPGAKVDFDFEQRGKDYVITKLQ